MVNVSVFCRHVTEAPYGRFQMAFIPAIRGVSPDLLWPTMVAPGQSPPPPSPPSAPASTQGQLPSTPLAASSPWPLPLPGGALAGGRSVTEVKGGGRGQTIGVCVCVRVCVCVFGGKGGGGGGVKGNTRKGAAAWPGKRCSAIRPSQGGGGGCLRGPHSYVKRRPTQLLYFQRCQRILKGKYSAFLEDPLASLEIQ